MRYWSVPFSLLLHFHLPSFASWHTVWFFVSCSCSFIPFPPYRCSFLAFDKFLPPFVPPNHPTSQPPCLPISFPSTPPSHFLYLTPFFFPSLSHSFSQPLSFSLLFPFFVLLTTSFFLTLYSRSFFSTLSILISAAIQFRNIKLHF